jgi:hypothetical protein
MRQVLLLAVFVSAVGWGDVAGKKVEVFGGPAKKMEFEDWLRSPGALLTPETTNLAIQSCLRTSQESIDGKAYDLSKRLVAEMTKAYPLVDPTDGIDTYSSGLAVLAEFLQGVDGLKAEAPDAYKDVCEKYFDKKLQEKKRISRGVEKSVKDLLSPLYAGRMEPRISNKLPDRYKDALAKLARFGVKLSPLRWETLRESVCTLEGYYSTSRDPKLWKFFSTTRAMSNVLPDVDRSQDFVDVVGRSAKVVALIKQLNEYSSVAGKYNGASIGMTAREMRDQPVRLTGAGLGSNAASLMAFFTTAWREGIQKHVIDQDYPTKPFQLIGADKVVSLTIATNDDLANRKVPSQTELGMVNVWNSVFYNYVQFVRRPDEMGELGEQTETFRKTAALAWLALNAETNIRQNEKIAGLERALARPAAAPTTLVFGKARQYESLKGELTAALAAYKVVDPKSELVGECVTSLSTLTESAAKALGEKSEVRELAAGSTDFLTLLKFEPVIADIGLEVDDPKDGPFRLHLATGNGRVFPATSAGKKYTVWTPSGLTLHLPKLTSTAQWQSGLVNQYDK